MDLVDTQRAISEEYYAGKTWSLSRHRPPRFAMIHPTTQTLNLGYLVQHHWLSAALETWLSFRVPNVMLKLIRP